MDGEEGENFNGPPVALLAILYTGRHFDVYFIDSDTLFLDNSG